MYPRRVRVLIAGCGYVGTALGLELAAAGAEPHGLRRSVEGLPAGIAPVAADLLDRSSLEAVPRRLDAVVYAASPDGRDEDAYEAAYVRGLDHLLGVLHERGEVPRRLVLVSSSGVWQPQGGEWVDEDTPAEPRDAASQRLLEGEAVARASGIPTVVVRFAGIYGPGRTSLLERVRRGEARLPAAGPRWTNRIHRDDCAGALDHLIDLADPADCYLGVDHAPEDEALVLRWLAGVLGATPPQVASSDPRREPRRGGNKRCRNDRLVASGYTFRYPSYREGYSAVLAGER